MHNNNDNNIYKNNKTIKRINIERKKLQAIINLDKIIKNKLFILELLYGGSLDRFLNFLSDDKIIVNYNSLIKKGYVTKREHFIYVIDNFITYFIDNFNDIYLILDILPLCVKGDKSDIFLSEYYLYDNEHIEYYITNFDLMIIDVFYNNFLCFKDKLRDEIAYIDNIFNIDDKKSMRKMLMFLTEICFVNKGYYGLLSLFEKVNDDNYNIYLSYWKILFENYFNNMEFIIAYRKFKNENNI